MGKLVALALLGISVIIAQNCSKVDFASQAPGLNGAAGIPATGGGPGGEDSDGTPGSEGPGLANGHFDLDTSHLVYPLSKGETDHHEHEFDDKFDVTQADFFALPDAFSKLTDFVPQDEPFIIIVANAKLSPLAKIEINGQLVLATALQNSASPRYSLNGSNGTTKLSSLKFVFDRNILDQQGLVATDTGCVRANRPTAQGEYRNGALTLQILRASSAQVDPNLGVATANGGLLWEATAFWHRDKTCL